MATSVLPSPVRISAIAAFVQDHAADQLDVEVALFQRSFCCFPDSGKGGRHQVVESLAGGKLGPKFVGLPAQFVIAQRLKLGLERVDLATIGR